MKRYLVFLFVLFSYQLWGQNVLTWKANALGDSVNQLVWYLTVTEDLVGKMPKDCPKIILP